MQRPAGSAAISATPDLPALTTDAIAAAVRALEPYMVRTLSDFVAAPSPSGQEQPAVAFMEGALRELGLESERIYLRSDALKDLPLFSPPCCPDGGRYNLLATCRPAPNRCGASRRSRRSSRTAGCSAAARAT